MNTLNDVPDFRPETYPTLTEFITDRPLVAQNMSPILQFAVLHLSDMDVNSGLSPEEVRKIEVNTLDLLAEKHLLDYGDYPEWYKSPAVDIPETTVANESDQTRRHRETKQAILGVAVGVVGMTFLWVTGKPKK